MSKNYLDPTIHCYDNSAGLPEPQRHSFKKYHRVKNTEAMLRSFEIFAVSRFPTADYVNYYWSDKPKAFAFRRYLTPKEGHSDG